MSAFRVNITVVEDIRDLETRKLEPTYSDSRGKIKPITGIYTSQFFLRSSF